MLYTRYWEKVAEHFSKVCRNAKVSGGKSLYNLVQNNREYPYSTSPLNLLEERGLCRECSQLWEVGAC